MSKILVKFYWDYGRVGSVNGLFVSTKEKIENLYGKEIYFGEILGKHSEVYGDISENDFTIISEDQDKIDWLEEIMESKTISGYNPLDYYEEDIE